MADTPTNEGADAPPRLELSWIPLGAGGQVVRRCGGLYERIVAFRQGRPPSDLYHAALVATSETGRYTIEMTPVPDEHGDRRGVVGGGAVGSTLLGRWRIFRYEVRCWPDGCIPDLPYAVGPPVVVSSDPDEIARVIEVVRDVPRFVWGRNIPGVRDMWNSNSVVAWTLSRAGVVERAGSPPSGGRAPGWAAGIEAARRPALTGGDARRVDGTGVTGRRFGLLRARRGDGSRRPPR